MSIKQAYNKPPKSFKEQLQQLKDLNLTVDNDEKALAYLSYISYCRLSAYFLPFQKTKNRFDDGTTFKQIIKTYSFDRELRLLVFDCIERIEIAIRTQLVYYMARHYNNSHWQDNKQLFIKPYKDSKGNQRNPYTEFRHIIHKATKSINIEYCIKQYIDKYDSPSNPPSWMCFELLTIGELSNIFRGLRNRDDKRQIAQKFDLHYNVFTSWLHSLTYVRNICAHHSRLWNRDFAIEPKKLLNPIGNWISNNFENNKRVFYFLCILKYFLRKVNPNNHLKEKLELMFKKYPDVPIKYIGIPSDKEGNLLQWQNEPIWQNENK